MYKRIMSLLLALLMVVTMVPVQAFATDSEGTIAVTTEPLTEATTAAPTVAPTEPTSASTEPTAASTEAPATSEPTVVPADQIDVTVDAAVVSPDGESTDSTDPADSSEPTEETTEAVCDKCGTTPCTCTVYTAMTKIGFVKKDNGDLIFRNNVGDQTTLKPASVPDYLIITQKIVEKRLDAEGKLMETVSYQTDSTNDEFYFGVLSSKPFTGAATFEKITSAAGLYATVANTGSVTMYKDLSVATDAKSIPSSTLAGEYTVADFVYEDTLWNWFVKLVPDSDWTAGEYCWLPAAYLATLTRTPTRVPVDPTEPSEPENKCDICGKNDCDAVHFYCEICKKYDCGKSHLICPACGTVDCPTKHTICQFCGAYDCETEHVDAFAPITAPVIPTKPQLGGEDVSIVGAEGENLSAGLRLEKGRKTSISAWSNLGENVNYQWQVCYNNANRLWVDIYGATSKGLVVSPAMFRKIIDRQGMTYIRCVTSSGEEVMISDEIPVTLVDAFVEEQVRLTLRASAPDMAAEGEASPAAEQTYSVTVIFQYAGGDEAAIPHITAGLPAGQNFVVDIPAPVVPGYKAEGYGDRITATINNISKNEVILVNYVPDYVDFVVEHYWQKVYSDDYELHQRETISKTLKTGQLVGNALHKKYAGFRNLIYDYTTPVAADGSTVIKIYYDREYLMLSLDLAGGFGVEPIYARYETSIPRGMVPERAGYTFAGWKDITVGSSTNGQVLDDLPASIPASNMNYQARWTQANAKYTVAFWYENANDDGYTFVGSVEGEGTTGTPINATIDLYNNATFTGKDAEHFKRLNETKTNAENAGLTINGDGTTVVNIYIYRETYTLTYYEFVCPHIRDGQHSDACCSITAHTHTNACCNKQHTSHNANCCILEPHTHSNDCCSKSDLFHWLHSCDRNNCGNKAEHTHGSGCTCNNYHDHSSGRQSSCNLASCSNGGNSHVHGTGCNTSACAHAKAAYFGCACANNKSIRTNQNNWKIATSINGENGNYTFKYEQDIGDIHSGMGSYRWAPGVCAGFPHISESENYGLSGAVGMVTSMPGGNTVFYRKSNGSYNYTVRFYLETFDSTESNRKFEHKGTFTPSMGAFDYNIDYIEGIPTGFAKWEQWACDSNWNQKVQMSAGDSFSNQYLNFNHYYIRKNFKVQYYNIGEIPVATRSMKFEQPLTSEFNLDGESLNLVSPYGPGYYFDSWCLDPQRSIRVPFDGSVTMPNAGIEGSDGLALYAKWIPLEYDLTITVDGSSSVITATYGMPPEVHDIPADPVKDGYNFIGWFYIDENGDEQAYNFSMPVYRNMSLYPKFTSSTLVSGTINFYIVGTTTKVADSIPTDGAIDSTKTYDAKIGNALYEQYRKGYYPDYASHSITFGEQGSPQNNYNFYYTKMPSVDYEIHFVNTKDNSEIFDTVYSSSETATITYDLNQNNRTKKGYAVDAIRKEFVLSSDATRNVFYFYYTKDEEHTTVQIEHYLQKLDGTFAAPITENPPNQLIGTTIKPTKMNISGYEFDHALANGAAMDMDTGVKLTDAGLVIELYYKRLSYPYVFRFVDNEGNQLLPDVGDTVPMGTTIDMVAPSILGYQPNRGSASITVVVEEPANVAENNVFKFVYTEEQVTIYYAVGAGEGGSVSNDKETVGAKTGNPVGSIATPDEDHVFDGWFSNYACTQKVGGTAAFKPPKMGGIYSAATYYAHFNEKTATIRYQVVMPAGVEDQAELTVSSEELNIITGWAQGTDVASVPKGYRLKGWYTNAEGTGAALNESGHTAFAPRKSTDAKWSDDTIYYAVFEEDEATIHFEVIGVGSVSPATMTVGMLTELRETDKAVATCAPFTTFMGWYSDEECTKLVSDQATFTPAMPATGWEKDNYFYAKFELNEYTISFVNLGEMIHTTTYQVGDALELPVVDANGPYELSWKVKETDGTWTDADIENGEPITCYGNVTLETVWKADVIWIDWDFNILTSTEEDILEIDRDVLFGEEHFYNGAPLTREGNAQYSYAFEGNWIDVDPVDLFGHNIPGLIIYRADYTETVNQYTVTFVDEDETVISSETYDYGTAADQIEIPADPEKSATAKYTYFFTGWTPAIVEVTGNAVYTATYSETVNEYTITFVNEDGTVLQSGKVAYDETPVYSGATPAKAATAQYTYTFKGWDSEIKTVTGDATYTATYDSTVNKYTVTWVNWNGKVLETDENVEYGDMPTYNGATPEKPEDDQYSYTFKEWAPAVTTVTGDVIYTATFTPVDQYYTVTWKNGSTVLGTESVKYGDTPSYTGKTPEKQGNEQFAYTFTGWNPAIGPISGNVTYEAQFEEIINCYTVTWVNEDGSVLETDENVQYGVVPSYDGETPVKPATAQYTYTFANWSPAVVFVTGDVTYTATYTETVNRYTVTFVDEDGEEISSQAYDYGTAADQIEIPANPEKSATAKYTYSFAGWTPAITEVTGNAVYTATYSETVNEYTITFVNEDGTVLQSGKVAYDETPVYSGATPTKAATQQNVYIFTGWNPQITAVTGDTTYTAQFTSTTNVYTVTWKNEDGTVLETDENVPYGTSPEFNGEMPAKADDAGYTYTFKEWTPAIVSVTGNAEYTATYTATEKTCAISYAAATGGKVGKTVDGPWYDAFEEVVTVVTGDPAGAVAIADAGYKFVGWYLGEECVTTNAAFDPLKEADEVFSAVTYTARFERALVSLRISTTCADQNQSFIFTIHGTPSDSTYPAFTQKVVLTGTDSILIKDLPVGTYSVTEVNGWSWRHNENAATGTFILDTEMEKSFGFGSAERTVWLSGYSYEKRRKGGN